jgi:hypothetical protein
MIPSDEIHVIWREDLGFWCARASIGDYGISPKRKTVIHIAKDAAKSTRCYSTIKVFTKTGKVCRVIKNFGSGKPSSQFFQDLAS